MMNGHLIPLKQIDRLERLVLMKKTGVLTMSVNNKAALLSLENGEIGYIFFRGRKGIAALSLLNEELSTADTESIELSFDAVPVLSTDNFISLTEFFLNSLKGVQKTTTQNDIVTDSGALAPIPGVLLTDRIKKIITQVLVELVGPVGEEACIHAFQTTRTLRVAIDVLAAELDTVEMAATFKARLREQLLPLQKNGYVFCVNEISKAEISASARAGLLLTEETRAMLDELLPKFLTPPEIEACRKVLRHTDSLRAAVDHISSQIKDPAAMKKFVNTVREKSRHLDQQFAVG